MELFGFFLLLSVFYRVWKLRKLHPETPDDFEELDRLYDNYVVYLFSGALVYSAGLGILVEIGLPIKHPKSLFLLLMCFTLLLFIIIKNYRRKNKNSRL